MFGHSFFGIRRIKSVLYMRLIFLLKNTVEIPLSQAV